MDIRIVANTLSIFFLEKNKTTSTSFFRMSSKIESLSTAMVIKSVVGYSTDLIKDIMLAIQISLSQGGLLALLAQKTPYIKGVSTNLQDNIRKNIPPLL